MTNYALPEFDGHRSVLPFDVVVGAVETCFSSEAAWFRDLNKFDPVSESKFQ